MDPVVAVGGANISPMFALLTLVLTLAVPISLVLIRLRVNPLVGYLFCGVLIGNTGLLRVLGFAGGHGDPVISQFAEIGVVLLMFTLGVEFPITEHRHLWRITFLGGGGQVTLTAGIAGLLAFGFGLPVANAVIMGIAVALSSTAVAMKSFQDMGQTTNPGARASLGIALFQDVLVILVFLVMPAIYRQTSGWVGAEVATALLKGVAFLGGAWLFGRYCITPVLHEVARTRSRELFTLTVIGLCVGVAFAGGVLSLSPALGAFAAGLVVSESIYTHRVLSDILPFKDLFLAIFFVSVGLLIDLSVVVAAWWIVLVGAAAILFAKSLIAFGVMKVFKLPGGAAALAAGSLASTGEFSLVLIGKAGGFRPFDPMTEQAFLACTAVTMALVPSLMRGAGPLVEGLEAKGLLGKTNAPPEPLTPSRVIKDLEDHAVICGYGPVGQALNKALKRCGVETLVVELNSDTVRALKKSGQPVLFADATHPEALDLAGIQRARLVAFTFPAVQSTCAAVPLVRERNPDIIIFGRAKYPAEVANLQMLDVRVVHDERECAVAMIRAAMSTYVRRDIDPEGVVKDTFGA